MVNKVMQLPQVLLVSYWQIYIKIVCSYYPAHKESICATTFAKIVFMKSASQSFLFDSRFWNYYHVIVSSVTTIAYGQFTDLYVQMHVLPNIAKTLMKKLMKTNTATIAMKMTVKVMLNINLTNGLIKQTVNITT